MPGFRGVRLVALFVVVCALAASASTVAAPAAAPESSLKTIAGTVSCTTAVGALQISAFAYRPSVGHAGAFVMTGPENTPAAFALVGAETDKANFTLDKGCSSTKKSVRLTHRGLSSAGVVKAGYNQSTTVFCGVPGRVIVRYRIGLADSGKPATAILAVWAKRKKSSRLREIGYVQWSRSRSVSYYSKKACINEY
jgi:hypothetical protein